MTTRLLDRESLSNTIDHVAERDFYGIAIDKREAADTTDWILGRFAAPSAYARTFGLTARDERERLHTFTGEPLTSRASNRHIHAEETCRALIVLNRSLSRKLPELQKANESLLSAIARAESMGKPEGTYCCGPCTVALWRHMAVGGLGAYSEKLDKGLRVLPKNRNDSGGWRRFPFFYTLLVLSELELPNANKEIRYALAECEKKIKSARGSGKYAQRKRDLLTRILQQHA